MGLGKVFRDKHRGETAYVIGSGASVDYIDPTFFAGKLCVCVNRVGFALGLESFYTVTHYHRDAMTVANGRPDLAVITPQADLGAGGPEAADRIPDEPNVYFFPTGAQRFGAFDVESDWPTEPDTLVAGPTSLHMTMHFAAYLGASSIVLVGADCGRIDDTSNFAGYSIGDNPFSVWDRTLPQVANKIRASGVGVYSLNPFVNFGLEGHQYRSPSVSIN
jgi:hypothetical protein